MFLAVINKDPVLFASVESALTEGKSTPPHLQRIGSVVMALARIAGGGIDGIIFDISNDGLDGGDPRSACRLLTAGAHGAPVLILCDAAGEAIAIEAVKGGATAYAIKDRTEDLARAAARILRKRPARPPDKVTPRLFPGWRKQVAIIGAKGGVGTTTVSLNLAAALAQTRNVILAEMRSGMGTLGQYFSVDCSIRSLIDLVHDYPVTAAKALPHLWRCPTVTRMKLLFASTEYFGGEIAPDLAAETCVALAELADSVIVDLPNVFCEANTKVIEASDLLLVVVDREPVCVAMAKQTIKEIQARISAPETGFVIVNRTALASPVNIREIEAELGVLCLGVIAPDADLCGRAQSRRMPLVVLDPESVVADGMMSLSRRVFPAAPPLHTLAYTGLSGLAL